MTLQVKVDRLTPQCLADIAGTLKAGGVVCFPTDTVYALAVNPSSAEAVERLFKLKDRAPSKPILLLVDSIEMVRTLSLPNPVFDELAADFWPGPLTLVTRAQEHLLDRLTAGTGTVGLRFPEASVPLQLVKALGGPITGTSANRSGQPVVRSAPEALHQWGDQVDVVIDGGPSGDTTSSTVLDVSLTPPVLLREGPVSYETLAQSLDGRLQRRSA